MKVLWSEVRSDSLANLKSLVAAKAKEARCVTIEDLASVPGTPSTGVYFFLENDEIAYIGRSASRAFIERVPSHFDTREEGWFGTLLKKLRADMGSESDSSRVLQRGLSMRIALLQLDDLEVEPGELENVLRHAFAPALNSPRKRREVDLSLLLEQVC